MAASLPPYPQMILEAIDGLKHDLPAGHVNELTDHLNKLKDSGELVFVKNNYMRPDPNAPLKRGRGRPAKAKDPSGVVETRDPVVVHGEGGSEMKRGRGRPRKDPNAPPAVKKVKVVAAVSGGRPRGRPRKVQPELVGVVAN
ncbi:hypothetical protein L6452_40173 [Arctium lappa]|uniref:Uncharacterized protein n=1 Tax=Arctium lappa TaxID=4217 RepID=A0ACB8XKK8_ARCLA|nr:hypothetical protein L6452_40173 [Arctium lappa]